MMSINKATLAEIGAAMVKCPEQCEGIANKPSSGILPRCLYLEEGAKGRGAVVVGMNPGKPGTAEEAYYSEHGKTYESVVGYWEAFEKKKENGYYTRLRKLIHECGIKGAILWTELAKCEKAKKASGQKSGLPVQTYRTCANIYLSKELEMVPKNWVVFAIGREAFKEISHLYPDRPVVGIPHPTGSFGYYSWLSSPSGLKPQIKETINRVLQSTPAVAEWLKGEMGE